MTEIDWDKPVEYVTDEGKTYPVLCSAIDQEGARHVLMQAEYGVTYGRVGSLVCFRNVRRKVKHEAKYWVITDKYGKLWTEHEHELVDRWRIAKWYTVTEHTHEWEAEVDE